MKPRRDDGDDYTGNVVSITTASGRNEAPP